MSPPAWITKASIKDGAYWLAIQVAIGLLPLWGTAMLFSLLGRQYEVYDLMRNGEFVLYAASFVTGGLYSVRHDLFPVRNPLLMTLIVLLVIATLVFAAISVLNIGSNPAWLKVDQTVLKVLSIVVFGISTLVCLGIAVAEAGNAGINIPEALRADRTKLEAGLDKLMKKAGQQ